MRITGGHAKGRRLTPLKGLRIRPSSDKVREAIFNLVGQDITGLNVLDLFSGTGSLGIEALSRGASWALFIDNSLQAMTLIKKNLSLCHYDRVGTVLKKDLRRGLPLRHGLMEKKFGLVFIDPPYGKGLIPPILSELSEKNTLAPSSIVIAETSKSDTLPDSFGKLHFMNAKTYGETRLNIYYYGEES